CICCTLHFSRAVSSGHADLNSERHHHRGLFNHIGGFCCAGDGSSVTTRKSEITHLATCFLDAAARYAVRYTLIRRWFTRPAKRHHSPWVSFLCVVGIHGYCLNQRNKNRIQPPRATP